jgi:hypothetical protein
MQLLIKCMIQLITQESRCWSLLTRIGTENGLYGIQMSSVIFLFYNFMNIPHWIPWKVLFPCAAPCFLWRNSTGNCFPLPTAIVSYTKYIFVCGMVRITKCCITFKQTCNKFNFHNGIKTTKTLSLDRVAWLSFRIACRTHQDKHFDIKQNPLTRNRCSLYQKFNTMWRSCVLIGSRSDVKEREPIRRWRFSRLYWHLLSPAGNT